MGLLGTSPEEDGDTGRGRGGDQAATWTLPAVEKTVLRTRVPFSQFVRIECRGAKPHAKQKSNTWKRSLSSNACD